MYLYGKLDRLIKWSFNIDCAFLIHLLASELHTLCMYVFMYVQGLEADLNEKNHINTVGFILQIINELMY